MDNSENNVGCCQLRSSCSLLHTSKYRAIIAIYILQISLTQARVQPAVTRWGGSTCPGSLRRPSYLLHPAKVTAAPAATTAAVTCLQYMALPGICIHAVVISLILFCGVNLHFVPKKYLLLARTPSNLCSEHQLDNQSTTEDPTCCLQVAVFSVVSRLVSSVVMILLGVVTMMSHQPLVPLPAQGH